jgi:hypothetical protein
VFLPILLKVSDDMISTKACQLGGSAQDLSGKTMTPWTFDIEFPLGTQFTFGSLLFTVWEDGDLKMLPQGQCQSIPLLLLHLHPDRDVHPPAIHQSTEFVFIGIVPQLRFI